MGLQVQKSHKKEDMKSIRSRSELHGHYLSTFRDVVATYAAIKQLPPIAAMNIDPDSTASDRLTPNAIHYLCDVELITSKTLTDPEEQATWFALATEDEVDDKLAFRVQVKCGRVYAARGLHPKKYFAPYRHCRKKVGQ